MRNNDFFKNQSGETNFVSLGILMLVIVVASFIFKPWILQLFDWVKGFIG